MKIYRISVSDAFKDMFGDFEVDDWKERQKHRLVSPPQQEAKTLTLYRGFDYLPSPNEDGSYTLSPDKSEQGALWFTHGYISRQIDPEEYARSHGEYFLTYPLQVVHHFQTVTYDNSSDSYTITPKDIEDKEDTISNCKYYSGLELPDGWFFSYKVEKFIIATVPITVAQSMIEKS